MRMWSLSKYLLALLPFHLKKALCGFSLAHVNCHCHYSGTLAALIKEDKDYLNTKLRWLPSD